MMKTNRFLVTGVFLLMFCSVLPVMANEVVGEIVYIEGSVDIFRDGDKLSWRQVDIGSFIEEFDMVQTGDDGYVEISLAHAGSGAMVTVQPETSFYFDLEDVEGPKKTEFAIMAGSMAFRVQKLTGNEAFQVRTESVAMGVRGTNFKIIVAPEGSVLCTCDEGLVECKTEDGQQAYSKPGQVVQKITEKSLETAEISPGQLDDYSAEWLSIREDVFKRGANTFIKGYGRRYIQMRPMFMQAYSNLKAVEPLLRRVEGMDSPGNLGTLFQIKREVSPSVVKMRSILPLFENAFFRLVKLSEYHQLGYGRGMIDSSTSTDGFFGQFDSLELEMKQRLSHTYYLLRLYQKLHALTGGGPSILDSPFEGGSGMPKSNFPESLGGSKF